MTSKAPKSGSLEGRLPLSFLLACSVLAVALFPAHVASGSPSTPTCNLTNLRSSRNIAISDASLANGAPAVQRTPRLGNNQRFLIHPYGSTLVLIQNVRSGKVLDVAGGSTADGAPVIQWDWNGAMNQLWNPVEVGNLTVFVNLRSGKVLDVSGASLEDGAPLIQRTWDGGLNQYFVVNCLLQPVPTTTTTTRPTTTTTTRPPTTTTVPPAVDEEAALCRLVNGYRAQNGLGPLLRSSSLTNAAKWHSGDMAQKNYFSHTDSLGRDQYQRMAAFGYSYPTKTENIAAGYATAAATLTQWKNSFLHNKELLSPSYAVMGIGRAYQATSQYGYYWTHTFGGFNDGGTPCPQS